MGESPFCMEKRHNHRVWKKMILMDNMTPICFFETGFAMLLVIQGQEGGHKMLARAVMIVMGFQIMLNITRPLITLLAAESLGAGTMEIGLLTDAFAFFPLLFAIHLGKNHGSYRQSAAGITGCVRHDRRLGVAL
jgi:hypothetical protein